MIYIVKPQFQSACNLQLVIIAQDSPLHCVSSNHTADIYCSSDEWPVLSDTNI